jgi:Protein of unknown function (DUF3631)
VNTNSVATAINIPNPSRNRKPSMRRAAPDRVRGLGRRMAAGSDNVIAFRSPGDDDAIEHSKSAEEAPVRGDHLLNDIRAAIGQFVWLPEPKYYDLLAVYALYTHAYDAFDHAPRLAVWSPTKGSGKSTLLCVLNHLVRKGEIRVSATPAILFRGYEQEHPTLLIDELDKHVNNKKLDGKLHEVMNAGHMRGAKVSRCNQDNYSNLETFDPFGPMVFAFKNVKLPDDLMDRCLEVKLRPAKGKGYKSFNTKLDAPKLRELAGLARLWAEQNQAVLEAAEPKAPSGVVDRRLSNWRPLLAVADAAGGEWPMKIREVVVWLEAQQEQEGELRILSDCKEVWDSHPDVGFLPTEDLLHGLNDREDWSWAGWNNGEGLKVTQLAAQLKVFEVCPTQRRIKLPLFDSGKPKRGYHRSHFERAWRDYGLTQDVCQTPKRKTSVVTGVTGVTGLPARLRTV